MHDMHCLWSGSLSCSLTCGEVEAHKLEGEECVPAISRSLAGPCSTRPMITFTSLHHQAFQFVRLIELDLNHLNSISTMDQARYLFPKMQRKVHPHNMRMSNIGSGRLRSL